MASKKKSDDPTPHIEWANEKTPEERFTVLKERGYDNAAIARYAAAARSWEKKDTYEWLVWVGVENLVKELGK